MSDTVTKPTAGASPAIAITQWSERHILIRHIYKDATMQATESPLKDLVINLFAASKRVDKTLQDLKDRRYQGLTVAQLKEIAQERNIKGRSRATTKAALVKLLQAN